MRKLFTPQELRERLETEAAHSVDNAHTRYCEGDLPTKFVFTLDGQTLCDAGTVIAALLREDGWHRPDVRVGPLAVTADAIVLEVSFPDEWSDVVPEGELAFPVEPFILVGPALPSSWVDGDPLPRVRLPTWPESGAGD